MPWTPLYINMEGKRVFILGSGEVGTRRARRFSDAGADVVVAGSPEDLEGVRFVGTENIEKWVKWADLVVAASADHELNEKISSLADGKLLNRADDPLRGNVVVPATFSTGNISIAIFTGTKSPLMARYLMDKIREAVADEDILMIELQDRVRNRLREIVDDQKLRKKILYCISEDPAVVDQIRAGNLEEALRRADFIIGEFKRGVGTDSQYKAGP